MHVVGPLRMGSGGSVLSFFRQNGVEGNEEGCDTAPGAKVCDADRRVRAAVGLLCSISCCDFPHSLYHRFFSPPIGVVTANGWINKLPTCIQKHSEFV